MIWASDRHKLPNRTPENSIVQLYQKQYNAATVAARSNISMKKNMKHMLVKGKRLQTIISFHGHRN
jgi:hypothetical protein